MPSSAAPAPPASNAKGYIVTYSFEQCSETGVLGSATPPTRQTTVLPQGQCVPVSSMFMSFTGGVTGACPKGKTGTVMAYQSGDCTTNSVTTGASSGPLPADGPGGCKNILPAGQSARFICS